MGFIEISKKAPAFTLLDHSGAVRTLKEFLGRWVVLYFYPEADTDLCTKQACGLRDSLTEFDALDAAGVGISPDNVEKVRAFRDRHRLGFDLLADEPRGSGMAMGPRVMQKYGAWGAKNMYGKVVSGTLRTTYLIDPHGRVAWRWDRVKTPGHAERVREKLETLRKARESSKVAEVRGTAKV